jgi:competence protein ComEA
MITRMAERHRSQARRSRRTSRSVWIVLVIAVALVAGYLLLGRTTPVATDAARSTTATTPQAPVSVPRPTGVPSAQGGSMPVVDLNTAPLAALETLPGITPEYAGKIVAGRPYRSMADLARTGIPRSVLDGISPPALIHVIESGPPPGGAPIERPRAVPPDKP